MKQSWEIKRLGDIAKFYRGLTYSKGDEVPSSTNMVLRSNNVDLETNALVYDDMKCLREDLLIDEDKKVKANSILICMSNGSKQHIGKVAYIQDDIDYAFGGFMGLIVPTKDIEGKYLYYSCVSHHFKHFLAGIGNGIGITNLRFSDLSSYCFPVPPIAEQEKIVAELDCLSGIIEKKKQQLKELDNLAQSIFYEMFGNPLRNERGWGMKRIADVCVVNPPKKVTAQGLGNKDVVSFLPMEDLPIKACYHQPDKTRLYEEVQSSYTCFANDDVLMAKVTPCFENGKLGIATNLHNGVGYGSSEFIVLRANNVDVIKEYIYFVTMDSLFIEKACAQLTGTSGLRRVPRQYVENCNITLPPLVLQQQFASKVEAIEKQKELIKQSIQEAETLFNSRMDYYFN